MNAIVFVFFLCGQPTHFIAAAGSEYTVSPFTHAPSVRIVFEEAEKQDRLLRIDLEDLTGHVCI